jgi:hypothetical protein
MPSHWTYAQICDPDSDLQQGDILAVSKDLQDLFREVHRHFCDPKYLAFIILTQTCDLARHDGACSVKYINVAAVRSLADCLLTLLDTVCEPLKPGIYSNRDRNKAQLLLDRIFNQNEFKLGLFYLFPDADVGIVEDAVAFLRVSVAFRVDHYDLIKASRSGRLKPEFANKLGWLAGNLFDRVGTPRDWTREDLNSLSRNYLSPDGNSPPRWIENHVLKHFERKGIDLAKLTKEQMLDALGEKIPSPKDMGIQQIIKNVNEVIPGIGNQTLAKLETHLKNDPILATTFR